MAHREKQLELPLLVVGPSDIARLLRELESLSDYLHQASLRKSDEEAVKLPRTSRMLDELAQMNELNLLQKEDRDDATQFLKDVAANSPVLTLSFAVDPSSAFIAKIIGWLRQNIHPAVLMRIGLQPSIAAGCTVRTANHYYDLSLRSHFKDHREILLEKLRTAGSKNE